MDMEKTMSGEALFVLLSEIILPLRPSLILGWSQDMTALVITSGDMYPVYPRYENMGKNINFKATLWPYVQITPLS